MMHESLLANLKYDENDPDVKSIMAQIRSYLEVTGSSGRPAPVERRSDARLGPEVYADLEQARNELAGLHASVNVTPTRLPIVGPLVQAVRRALHRLVVYYVNRIADVQTRINTRLLAALSAIVVQLDCDDQAEHVQALETRVQTLEGRLQALEAAAERPESGQKPRE